MHVSHGDKFDDNLLYRGVCVCVTTEFTNLNRFVISRLREKIIKTKSLSSIGVQRALTRIRTQTSQLRYAPNIFGRNNDDLYARFYSLFFRTIYAPCARAFKKVSVLPEKKCQRGANRHMNCLEFIDWFPFSAIHLGQATACGGGTRSNVLRKTHFEM